MDKIWEGQTSLTWHLGPWPRTHSLKAGSLTVGTIWNSGSDEHRSFPWRVYVGMDVRSRGFKTEQQAKDHLVDEVASALSA